MDRSEQQGWLDRLSPEIQLLLYCARPVVATSEEDRIRQLLEARVDWAAVHLLGYRHSQIPTLALHLERVAPHRVPTETLEMLRKFSASQRRRNQFLLETMLDLVERFASQGIPVLPYLESMMALGFCAMSGGRPIHLIDIVVRREDRWRAAELVRSLNLWQAPPAELVREVEKTRFGSIMFPWGPRDSGVSLHWETAPWLRSVRLNLQELWSRSVSTDFGGQLLPSLSPEDTLLHLCVANTEILWVSLTGICDIAKLLHAHPTLRWEEVLLRARESGTLSMLFVGLRLAGDLLGVAIPERVWNLTMAASNVTVMAEQVRSALFNPEFETNRMPETIRFHLRARENFADRLRYLWRYLTQPTDVDRNLVRLPDRLAILYSWLRPFRLAGTVLRRAVDRPLQRLAPSPRSFSGYSPTGRDVVKRMLEMAETGPKDVVFDIGCGDGRILIEAARLFGARGVGIDIDPERIRESKDNARRAGVEGRVSFLVQDASRLDLSRATVVTLYLPLRASRRLTERLLAELTPGARIVCHNYAIEGWEKAEVFEGEGQPALLYMRKVSPNESASSPHPRATKKEPPPGASLTP